jgi:hypothetical protein
MPDIVDLAQYQEQVILERAFSDATLRGRGPVARGACLWCEEPLAPGLRWCDADCRSDWEKYRDDVNSPRNILVLGD